MDHRCHRATGCCRGCRWPCRLLLQTVRYAELCFVSRLACVVSVKQPTHAFHLSTNIGGN